MQFAHAKKNRINVKANRNNIHHSKIFTTCCRGKFLGEWISTAFNQQLWKILAIPATRWSSADWILAPFQNRLHNFARHQWKVIKRNPDEGFLFCSSIEHKIALLQKYQFHFLPQHLQTNFKLELSPCSRLKTRDICIYICIYIIHFFFFCCLFHFISIKIKRKKEETADYCIQYCIPIHLAKLHVKRLGPKKKVSKIARAMQKYSPLGNKIRSFL